MEQRRTVKKSRVIRKHSTVDDRDASSVEEAIKFLNTDGISKLSAWKSIKRVQAQSQEIGLGRDHITELVDIIERDSLDDKLLKILIQCLIPADDVPAETVLTAVQILTQPEVDVMLQVELAKWMCAVYKYVDSKDSVICLYSVIFSLIENDLLQPYICELLCKMTSEDQALPFRITTLISLQSRMGPQPHILALLQLYSNFRPDVVLVHSKYKKVFRPLGKVYENVNKVKNAGLATSIYGQPCGTKAEQLLSSKQIMSYSHLSEIINSLQGNIDLSKFLQSPIRRTLLLSNLSDNFMIRLRIFIRVSLYAESFWVLSRAKFHSMIAILPVLTDICNELQEGMPDICTFITHYLQLWDGQKDLDKLLALISQWNICSFQCMTPLYRALYQQFCFSNVEYMCAVLECFTNLYRNWVLFELPRLAQRRSSSREIDEQMTIFDRYDDDVLNPCEAIDYLAHFIDQLCNASLLAHNDHPTVLLYQVLRFYNVALSLHRSSSAIKLQIPSQAITCALFFTSNPAILAQVCDLLCGYKTAISHLKESQKRLHLIPYIEVLNGYICDLCNMLALNRAFHNTHRTVFFQTPLPPEVRQFIKNPRRCFEIYRHPAVLGLSLRFMGQMREEPIVETFVTDPAIRKSYFTFLTTSGFGSIVTFLKTFVSAFQDTL